MGPGRKAGASRQQPREEITDIERERDETIKRNNEVFRSFGISTLASIVNRSFTKSKGKVQEESDPLYEADEDMEETGDDVLDEGMLRSILAKNTIRNTAATRGSKRVSMPSVGQDQTTRMTRQRTKQLSTEEHILGTTTNAQEDALVAIDCTTQDDEQIQTCFEGEPNNDLITQRSRGKSMGRGLAQPTPEGEQPKTPAEVVAHVLPSSKFLKNVGLDITVPKRSATSTAHVKELEIEVAKEKQGAAALRDQLRSQQDELEVLKKKVEESEEAREKQTEEIENLKKQGEETNALLRRLFTLNKD